MRVDQYVSSELAMILLLDGIVSMGRRSVEGDLGEMSAGCLYGGGFLILSSLPRQCSVL